MYLYNEIITETERLIDFPYIAAVEPLLEDEKETYRSLVVHQHFKVIYFIDEEMQSIVIVRIWDCRQDPKELQIH